MMPAGARGRHVVVEERQAKLAADCERLPINRIEWAGRAIGVITSGAAYQYTKEALPEASVLKLGMVNPLPVELIREFAAGVETLYVAEELDPIIENHCKATGVKVIGKELFSLRGELSQKIIREKILGKSPETLRLEQPVPVRPPVMCPGCPHRGLFYTLSKLKVMVSGDIGCYTLGATPPLNAMDTTICMGASVSGLHGFNKARGSESARNSVAVIGDSTFIHSGITGLINITYNQGISTVIILDNRITGMTGHQQNPTTGYTLKGVPTPEINIEKICEAANIKRVRVVDPNDLRALEAAVKEELAVDEPSVIITRRPCALLKSVKHEPAFHVDAGLCRSCKACFKIGCPAITLSEGNKAAVDPTLCVGCGLCQELCAFHAIKTSQEV